MKKEKTICENCKSKNTIRKGMKRNKLQTMQRYLCKNCNKTFTLNQTKQKTYQLSLILNALSLYNLGHTLQKTSDIINKKNETSITAATISTWLSQYKTTCTFARLRKEAIKKYNPKNIISKKALNHIQPYTFQHHKAKLDILLKQNPNFASLKDYIERINSKKFPHHIFTHHQENIKNTRRNKFFGVPFVDNRASEANFKYLDVKINKKENLSIKLAKLALNLAKSNKERHQKIQDFMLINDGTTIATEIPTYLTNWDAAYYKNKKGFVFPLNNYKTPITGHIDMLQISNGLIYILDYKPDAHLKQIQEQAIQQLTIYAMALSKKLNLALSDFKCAWFDHNNYFEFFPLHAVYQKNNKLFKP